MQFVYHHDIIRGRGIASVQADGIGYQIDQLDGPLSKNAVGTWIVHVPGELFGDHVNCKRFLRLISQLYGERMDRSAAKRRHWNLRARLALTLHKHNARMYRRHAHRNAPGFYADHFGDNFSNMTIAPVPLGSDPPAVTTTT